MADEKPGSNFDLFYFFKGEGIKDWWKALGMGWRLVVIVITLTIVFAGIRTAINWFVKPQQNISQPKVVALPGSTVGDIDMRSIQVTNNEKSWEVGFGGAILRYDNKDGAAGFGWIKKKF